jgi:hypothetical protein
VPPIGRLAFDERQQQCRSDHNHQVRLNQQHLVCDVGLEGGKRSEMLPAEPHAYRAQQQRGEPDGTRTDATRV